MNSINEAAVAMSDILEMLHPLASEFVMFALAAVFYLLWTRAFMVPEKRRKKGGSIEKVTDSDGIRKTREPRKMWRKEMEESSPVYHTILQHAKSGDASLALSAVAELDAVAASELPAGVAAKVLLALARSSDLCEDTMHKFMDLSQHFDGKVFEAAASEASRWRSVQACRQLFHLAGLASIQKSEKLLVLLVRGHSNDHAAMTSLVEDILSQTGASLSRFVLDALASQCIAASNRKAARLLQDHGDASMSAQDPARQARMISNYGKEGNLQAALDVFSQLKESGAIPNTVVYNCLLDACIECRDLPRALSLFEEMKGTSVADVVSYNTIMKGHLQVGSTQAAHKVFSDMTASGLLPSRVTYHALLNAMVQKGDRSAAWRLVDEMKSNGIGANTITCTILLKSIASRPQGAELHKILALSDSCDVAMDEVLFGAFADAAIRCGNLKLLWDRYSQHTSGEKPVQVSGPTYGSMMKAFGQAQDVQRVRSLWKHMDSRKVKLTAVTLGCMVEALVANNNAAEAWELVNATWASEELRELVNTVIYSTIVKGFTMLRQHDKVVAIYKEMKARGIACNTITYNTMLNALARCGMMHEVPQLLEDMRDSDPPVQPDIVTYSTIVKGYCMAGDVDRAFALLKEMKKGNAVTPDEVLYNSLLDGCAKQSRVEEALGLLEEMKAQGVVPSNYTLSILCKLLGRARRLDQAFGMVQTFTQQYGFKANIQVYTCLMQACIHNRQCHRVLALHDEVVRTGSCTPDEKTYTVMLRGCLQAGQAEKALAVVRCAYHLQGHSLLETPGAPQGVEAQSLEELLSALGPGPQREKLIKDLHEQRGLAVSVPTQARRQRHQGQGRGGK
mmetsp:Transcript_58723/g.109970  ORF Transcript_58723/g.109970 Transcript_58723/m.109970 type:complete len:850 (-) Transcript_58723:43-2592(-)